MSSEACLSKRKRRSARYVQSTSVTVFAPTQRQSIAVGYRKFIGGKIRSVGRGLDKERHRKLSFTFVLNM